MITSVLKEAIDFQLILTRMRYSPPVRKVSNWGQFLNVGNGLHTPSRLGCHYCQWGSKGKRYGRGEYPVRLEVQYQMTSA